MNPPRGIWCHIAGIDLVRDGDGQIYVLEDNLRVPSGVSYVLENREVLKRTFPQVFEGLPIRPVSEYPNRLLETLESPALAGAGGGRAVVLTPGVYNSAYFEHSFLAQQMETNEPVQSLIELGCGFALLDRAVYRAGG